VTESSTDHQLQAIVLGDPPRAWSDAGFAVEGHTLRIGDTVIECCDDDRDGIAELHIDGLGEPLDGLPIASTPAPLAAPASHPNGVVSIDHLVVLTPDCDRTTSGFESVGLEARRVRRFEAGGSTRRQTFFWLGDVILELVGADEPAEAGSDGPSVAWGLALTCSDLDATAASLGDKCGAPKAAVQRGRRIATLRTRDLGISIPVALMSPHPDA
jgi:hypothetical protein